MILPDTSAWIEFLRRTGHPIHLRFRAEVERGEGLAFTEPIAMEILAGARSGGEEGEIRARLFAHELFPVRGLEDFEAAAEIYRTCRSAGETIRSLIDCLIASVAIRNDLEVLHADTDFDVIARHTGLRIAVL